MNYYEDETFENKDFTEEKLAISSFEYCTFINCNFQNLNLSQFKFMECDFTSCNLSNILVAGTTMQKVNLTDCKVLGVQFEHIKSLAFGVNFEACALNYTTFYQLNLTKCQFNDCELKGVDFSEADLSGILFTNNQLAEATFEATNLEKTDLRGSTNYLISPTKNKVQGAKFSLTEISGLLHEFGVVAEE